MSPRSVNILVWEEFNEIFKCFKTIKKLSSFNTQCKVKS